MSRRVPLGVFLYVLQLKLSFGYCVALPEDSANPTSTWHMLPPLSIEWSDFECRDSLMCRASMVPGLTNTNATLTAENSRLNDRMAKLIQDLTEENKHLLDENQRLNQTVQKVQPFAPVLLIIVCQYCIIA